MDSQFLYVFLIFAITTNIVSQHFLFMHFVLSVDSNENGLVCLVSGGKLCWADGESAQPGTVTKSDGRNPLVLRNKTSGVVHMKVFDREGQKGRRTLVTY